MSMQQSAYVDDTYKRALTCLSWSGRDIVCGYEDGTMKFFDADGVEKHSVRHHVGNITCFLYLPSPTGMSVGRLFVASNDSSISVWNCDSMALKDTINMPFPVFSLCLYQNKNIIVGLSRQVHIYKLHTEPKCETENHVSNAQKGHGAKNARPGAGKPKPHFSTSTAYHYLDADSPLVRLTKNHFDVIKFVVAVGSRFFTGDASGRMCIYDYAVHSQQGKDARSSSMGGGDAPSSAATAPISSNADGSGQSGSNGSTKVSLGAGSTKMKISCVRSFAAHDAGITSMICVVDSDNNTFLMTGSYDRTVKIWSSDGKCRHVLDCASISQDFSNTVTAIAWNSKTRTAWIACDSTQCVIYDPKSNENVSDFVAVNFDTSEGMAYATGKSQSTRFGLCTVKSNEKQRITHLAFQSNAHGSFSVLNGTMVAGTAHAKLIVWKHQAVGFKSAIKCQCSVESLAYCNKAPILLFNGGSDGDIQKWERQACLFMYENHALPYLEAYQRKRIVIKELEAQGRSKHTQPTGENHVPAAKKQQAKPNSAQSDATPDNSQARPSRVILRLVYNEAKDLLIAACEDHHIYVWGFDEEQTRAAAAIYALNSNGGGGDCGSASSSRRGARYGQSRQEEKTDDNLLGFQRVSGFICKYVFIGHENIITSLALVGDGILVSSGWDKKLFAWDLDKFEFIGALSTNGQFSSFSDEWVNAADQEVLDLAYAPEIQQIAIASSDSFVYVRKFSVEYVNDGMVAGMPCMDTSISIDARLVGALKHEHEANVVCWVPSKQCWVTASQDERIRVWASSGGEKETDAVVEGLVEKVEGLQILEEIKDQNTQNTTESPKTGNDSGHGSATASRSSSNASITKTKSVSDSPELVHKCILELSCNCPVSVMAIDHQADVILAALDHDMHIYCIATGRLLQVKHGHAENIRCILPVPERRQYVTGSWDRQLLVWPAYTRPRSATTLIT